MLNSFKYRSVAFLLAGVFTIFSVGIPIVIASCPMMKASVRPSCCPEKAQTNSPTFKKYRDYSCCKTVVAADRNKTEFLQTQNDALIQLHNYSVAAVLHASNIFDTATFSKLIINDTHSPPLIEDIPIFKSSLLI